MRLKILFEGILTIDAAHDCEIYGLSQDTRTLKPGDLFFAYPGHTTDGRQYIAEAVSKGAAAIVSTDEATFKYSQHSLSIPILFLANLKTHLGEIAAKFYHYPARHMTLIGITGTNGKTTCSHCIATCLAKAHQTCGVIGSIANGYYDLKGFQVIQQNHHHLTTPHALELQYLLSIFREKSIQTVVIEVSSHALDQYRVHGLNFQIAALTNVSHDHLDYHLTMEHYAQTKRRLFEMAQLEHAIFNLDDSYGRQWHTTFASQKSVYGYTTQSSTDPEQADYKLCTIKLLADPTTTIKADIYTPWGKGYLKNTHLIGHFMVSNLLLVITVLGILNLPLLDSLRYVSELKPIRGRMQKLGGKQGKPLVVIDYAHTPDALENTLQTLRPIKGRLWCVFGCGGNRDRQKRPLMGKVAAQYADKVVLTQDNPRYEDGKQIIDDILSGIHNTSQVIVYHDRQTAINFAVTHAHTTDVILITGKGHEAYQIIEGVEFFFDDYIQAQAALVKR